MCAVITLALSLFFTQSPQQAATPPSAPPAQAAQATTPGSFIVAGTVTNATTGDSISKAEVSLIAQFRGPEPQILITNASGSFAFTGVVPGRYTLSARRRGFLPQSYLQHGPYFSAVLVGPEFDTANLSLRLPATAVITGHVYDQSGEPVRHAQVVVAMREDSDSASRFSPRGNAQTDDEGRYRVAHLQPGTYFVAVSVQPWYAQHPQTIQPTNTKQPPPRGIQVIGSFITNSPGNFPPPDPKFDVVYELTYFGGTTELSGAQAIRLESGEIQSADVSLTPVPARHIRLNLGGEANQYPNITRRNEFGAFPIGSPIQVYQIEPGVWELAGVPPGRFSATVRVFDQQNPAQQRVENLELGAEAEVNLTSSQPVRVTVRGTLSGEAGFQPAGSSILLTSPNAESQFNAQVSADGTFEFREKLAPGAYTLVVNGGNVAHYLTSLTATGARVSGRHIELGSQDANLTLTVSGNLSQCSGFVNREGKHTAGMLVVLLPQDAATRDIAPMRFDQSDADGSYAFRNVLPGKYSLFALDNAWDQSWNSAEFLSKFAAEGQLITAQAGAQKTFELSVHDAKAKPAKQ